MKELVGVAPDGPPVAADVRARAPRPRPAAQPQPPNAGASVDAHAGTPQRPQAQRRPGARARPRPFNLLRWFSIASLGALIPVAAAMGVLISQFVTQQTLERDALVTGKFIENCLIVEAAQIGVPSLVPFLDPRADTAPSGLSPARVTSARMQMYEHLATLPDVLLANVYGKDRRIVWSTNPSLVDTYSTDNAELEQAFRLHADVARHHGSKVGARPEQKFMVEPQDFFIENYVPLLDAAGTVVAVVEVYKEPRNLMDAIRTAEILVWTTTLAGGVLVYLGVFGIVRRGSRVLAQQQRKLLDAQSQAFAGEMARALAHSLRNPLGSVRSSAELASCTHDEAVRKNAQDIINQVDFLSQWIRELLLYSRPLSGTPEALELCTVLESVLASFTPTFERARIRVSWERNALCHTRVQGNASLARQALHSVISNAVEAMPGGGDLRIELRAMPETQQLELVVRDTGIGMSRQQLARAFRTMRAAEAGALGAGLPLLRRAMERFGGSVLVSSEKDAGTQVRLHFRAAAGAATA